MNSTAPIRALTGIAAMWSFALAASLAQAIQISETTSTVAYVDDDGNVESEISQVGRLPLGGNLTETLNEVIDPQSVNSQDPATAAVHTTFEASPIKQYQAGLTDPAFGALGYLNGTFWWVKESAHLKISAADGSHRSMNNVLSQVTKTRDLETHAILAYAPNSFSGFADASVPASTGGGNGVRLLVAAYFQGGDITDDIFLDPTTPGFVIGDGFSDLFGEPPGPTFGETLMALNTGHTIVVDLDAAGVAVGEDYRFIQSYKLGVGPGVRLTGNQVAFVDIDPLVGYATVPEPATLGMFILALAGLGMVRGRHSAVRDENELRPAFHR